MIYINDVGGNGLGKPKKGFKKFLNIAKIAVAPHTLLKKPHRKPVQKTIPVARVENSVNTVNVANNANNETVTETVAETVEDGNGEEIGLGKVKLKKVLKKIKLKTVVKQVGKVAKFAAPIAAGFIPLGGGVASKITSKVLNSKAGKVVSKVAKSKVAKKVQKLSKTKAGALVVNKAKAVARPKIEEIKTIGAATFAKTETQAPQANTPYTNEGQTDNVEPVGELTPVKPIETVAKVAAPISKTATPYANEEQGDNVEPVGELTPVKQTAKSVSPNLKSSNFDSAEPAKKDNTMLYIGGAVALGAVAYLATKK